MKLLLPSKLLALFASLFAAAQMGYAQSTWTGSTNTNNWNNAANWNNGIVPNAVDATAVFNAIGNTRWTNATNTIGTLLATGGTATIGDPSVASQGLLLSASTGKPVISNASQIFMYADLQGTNGFTKLGVGELTFRYNTRDLGYTGDINLNAGTLTLQKDRSLGDTNNDIIVGGNSTLSFAPSTAGNISLAAGRSVSISNGTRLTVLVTSANSPVVTINGDISGSGALTKSGTDTLTLAGANTYSGGTVVSAGRLAGSTTSLQGAITNNSAVTFDQTTNGTYAAVMSGSGSLLKSGAGTVTLGGANTYSGGTLVSAGTLAGDATGIQGAVTNNATVQFSQTANGTYAGLMSGSGSLLKSGDGTLTLGAANTYSGTTTISAGRIALSGSGAISTGNLAFSGTTPGSLELGGNAQTVANISSTFTSAGTVTVTNGSLTVNGDATQSFANALNGTVWDLSGLGSFTFNRTNREFIVRPVTAAGSVTNTLNLAASGNGLNTVSASSVVVGAASGSSTGSNHLGVVSLGRTNTINTGSLDIGGYNGAGSLAFAASVTNGTPTLTLRAADGTSRLGAVTVGATSAGVNERLGNGTLDLTGGSVDASIGTMIVGRQLANANSAVTGSFTMQAGTVDATSLVIAEKSATTGTPTINGTFNQSGGSVTASTVYLGNNQGTAQANLVANYNLTGGTLYAQNIGGNGTDYGASTVRNLNVNGGTVRNISGSDLTVNGLTNTASGRINVVLGASGGTFQADSGSSITIGSNSLISGSGQLAKLGGGTLILSSSNTYSGGTAINNGVLQLGAGGGTGSLGGGNVTIASGAVLAVDRTGLLSITNLLSGGGVLRKESAGTLTLTGNNTYSGGTLLNGGELVAGHVSAFGTGSITVGSATTLNFSNFNVANAVVNNGGTISGTGTMSDVDATAGETTIGGANSTITQISGTATVNVNAANASVAAMSGGTLNVNASGAVVTNLTGGSIAVSSGVTVGLREGLSSGVISGAGGVAKQGASTLTLSGANTYGGATTVEAGRLVVNGSISNSAVTVQNGAVLGGSGVVGATTILSGATIAPGNSPGSITNLGDLTWSGGGSYDWEIFNATGAAGTDWDFIAVTDQLLFTNISPANTFSLNIYSLSGLPSTAGPLAGWNSSNNYSWTILAATNGISGFSAANFTLNLGNFTNNNALSGGLFSLAQDGNDLKLLFTAGVAPAVPEPGTWAAAAVLVLAGGYVRLRRRSRVSSLRA